MKKIESQEDFTAWCQTVNHAMHNKICDLQDVFARSEFNELKGYFVELPQNDKELAVFSIQKAMGSATLFEFIKLYAQVQAEKYIQKEIDEIEDRWAKVLKAETDFQADKNKLRATITALESQNAELVKDNDTMSIETARLYNRIQDMELELIDTKAELDKQWAFESHIKGLLQAA